MQLGFAKSGDPQLKGVARNIGNGTYSKNQSQSALESEAPGTPGARNANGLTFHRCEANLPEGWRAPPAKVRSRRCRSAKPMTISRYAARAVKQRLHQASFREAAITAYDGSVPFHREFVRREFDALYAMHLDAFGHDAETGVAPIGIPRVKRHCFRNCGEVQPSRR
jgi:hypothetical protein